MLKDIETAPKGETKELDGPKPTKLRTPRHPLWTAEELRSQLRLYDRRPFIDMLAIWAECAPDPVDIIAFAERNPEKYIAALQSLGRLAGFTEKKEIDVDVHVHIRALSDSQLEDKLKQITHKLEAIDVDQSDELADPQTAT